MALLPIASSVPVKNTFVQFVPCRSKVRSQSAPPEIFIEHVVVTSFLKEKRQRWHEELAKDVYMEEAINVLEDLKINNIRRGKLADVRD